MALGCGPEKGGETDGGGSATGPTTGSQPSADMGDGLGEHGPCPQGDECELCVRAPEGSVCGPPCFEYGPGPAPGRCPPSPVQGQSICPWDHDTPAVCLILCDVDAHCPDPGMRCVDCPEPFSLACHSLWGWTGTGPRLCVWPG